MENTKILNFRGGPIASAAPILFFVLWAITCSLIGISTEASLIIGAVIGLLLGLILCKDSADVYLDAVTKGMTQSVAAIAIIAWFWAGTFAEILKTGGLVDGLVWLGVSTAVSGGLFTLLTFILSASFGTAVGTGYGTLVAFTTLMYPAGVALGANPVVLMGAICGGSCFGDNLAPVSDTTIISAATQNTDVMGVVKSRFKYCCIAAVPAFILYTLFGGSGSGVMENVEMTLSPKGLVLLIPFALVLLCAFKGKNLIVSISVGIAAALAVGLPAGLFTLKDILYFNVESGMIEGAVANGIGGYLHMCVVILLIMSLGYLTMAGNLMQMIEHAALKHIGTSARKADFINCTVVAAMNLLMSVNAAAEITAAPLVSSIGEQYNIHPYRRANSLDAISAAGGFVLPWSGGTLLAVSTANALHSSYSFLPQLTAGQLWYCNFYGWILIAVMFISAATGFGLLYKGKNGEPVKAKDYERALKEGPAAKSNLPKGQN